MEYLIQHIGIICDESQESIATIKKFLKCFWNLGIKVSLPKTTFETLTLELPEIPQDLFFSIAQDYLWVDVQIILSIGGDGTVLRSMQIAVKQQIPLLGLNTGRLGFLNNSIQIDIPAIAQKIICRNFEVSKRSLIEMSCSSDHFKKKYIALNEISILRKEITTMITINMYINTKKFTSYWGDGLIISTSTGSTAYSLSCGGPIMDPDLQDILLISPLAPHNLNVRPLILTGDKLLQFDIFSRNKKDYSLSTDISLMSCPMDTRLQIKLSNKKLSLAFFSGYSFWDTLHEKLYWGMDKRNVF